jgi:triacylglycerol esterase/lipase EstA (alpha/beta hydrolase family)
MTWVVVDRGHPAYHGGYRQVTAMSNSCPAIFTHGLFGWGPAEVGGFPYWGTAALVDSPLPRHFASVGPVSSVHDRACELAFQIKGGTVDYGQRHAVEEGHARYGRSYDVAAAFHPDWSSGNPVHLVGHSMGAPTIWMLQHLLAIDFFGWGSDANWVKSISAVSGVLNGSTATYYLGCDEETGLLREDSIGDFLTRAIELHLRITGDVFDRIYDFDLDHWDLQPLCGERLPDLLARIAMSPMFRGRDNAAYSLTVQGQREQNLLCLTYPDTWYFSYVTEQTFPGFLTDKHYPEPMMNPFMIPTALHIGRMEFREPFFAGFNAADWWHNDGLVPVYSQMYPRLAGDHPVGGQIGDRQQFEAGRWYHEILCSTDHIDIVAMPQLGQIGEQKRFYSRLLGRLASL